MIQINERFTYERSIAQSQLPSKKKIFFGITNGRYHKVFDENRQGFFTSLITNRVFLKFAKKNGVNITEDSSILVGESALDGKYFEICTPYCDQKIPIKGENHPLMPAFRYIMGQTLDPIAAMPREDVLIHRPPLIPLQLQFNQTTLPTTPPKLQDQPVPPSLAPRVSSLPQTQRHVFELKIDKKAYSVLMTLSACIILGMVLPAISSIFKIDLN